MLLAARKFLGLKFSDRIFLIGALIGMLPDIDIPAAWVINWIFGTQFYFHKIYTHALVIPLLLFATAMMAKRYSEKTATAILVAAIAWLTHVVADCYLSVGMNPTLLPAGQEIMLCRNFLDLNMLVNIDAASIFLFVAYLAWKNKNDKSLTR